jgi:hypothetical protein
VCPGSTIKLAEEVMTRWQDQLARLVRLAPTLQPPTDPQWSVEWFRVASPSGGAWPEGCPCCPALLDFYAICDGARFPWFGQHYTDWLPLADLRPRTLELVERFQQQYLGDEWDGMPEFGRHLVFAHGANDYWLIWDSSTDRVFSHNAYEDDWNEQDETVEEMLQAALLPRPYPREWQRWQVMEWWLDTLQRVEQSVMPGASRT